MTQSNPLRSQKMGSNRKFLLMTLLTLLAFGLRAYNLGANSLWYDELLQLDVAQGPLSDIGPQLTRHAAMPLDYYILHGWIPWGRQETWVRWPALLFGVLAMPLIYVLAGRMFNRRVGVLAALLLTVASFALQYSQEVRPYALLSFFTMIGYFGLWQVYTTYQIRYWIWVMVGIVGATLTHYFALFMLLPMGLFVAVQQVRHLRQSKFWEYSAYFGLCLLILLTVLILLGRFRFLYNVSFGVSSAISQPETLALPAVEKPNRGSGPPLELSFFVNKVFGPLASGDPSSLLIYNLFFGVAVLSLLRPHQTQRAAILLLLGWLVLPILLIYLFLLYRGTFYAIRYILYTLPAYLILVAYGIDTWATLVLKIISGVGRNVTNGLGSSFPRLSNLLAGGILLLALLPLLRAEFDEVQTYYAAGSREDWRAVGQLLRDHAGPNDAIIAVRAEPTMNWYYPAATAPFGAFGSSQPIWQAITAHPRRWFVLSSYSQRRDKNLKDWLHNNQAVVIGIDRRVVVYLQHEGLTAEELLAQVRDFSLPQKAITYATLASQFDRYGDPEASQIFYQKALELADPDDKQLIDAQLGASLPPKTPQSIGR